MQGIPGPIYPQLPAQLPAPAATQRLPIYLDPVVGWALLFAFITRPACEELELQAGVTVTALIKAPAVHLIARGL